LALGFMASALAEDAPVDLHPQPQSAPKPPARPADAGKEAKPKEVKPTKDGDAAAKPELTADQAVAKADEYFDAMRVMTADFVQIGPDGARTEGQLYVQRPGKLFFHYNPPAPLEIVADGRSVAVRDHKLGTQDLYFIQQTPLKFLLADHLDLAKDTTVKRVSIDENAAMIQIEDKATFGGKSEITLIFDPTTFALKQWTVTDAQGFQTVVSLYDIDLVSKPDPNLFQIDESSAVGPARRH
jgi:outer membrane lipoprotein-sorting protein